MSKILTRERIRLTKKKILKISKGNPSGKLHIFKSPAACPDESDQG